MAISMKNWKDRITQYPNRRKLINVSTGEETIVDVVREEGNVTEDGDTFTAANMTDFESKIYNAIYPVGSIYMSVNNVNPSTLFGGTWVAWGAGRVPVGVDTTQTEFDTVEETGGTKEVTLTAAQSGVPAHTHDTAAMWEASSGAGTNNVVTGYPVTNKDGSYGIKILANTAQNASQAHTNLQPYITCYMWKRTA